MGLLRRKHTTTTAPTTLSGTPPHYPSGFLARRFFHAVDRAVHVQSSAVDKAITRLVEKNPHLSTAQQQERLDKYFTNTLTGSGVGSGGLAAVPGLGTLISAVTIGGESMLLLELCGLYALASAKLHGWDIHQEDTRRTIVFLAISGGSGRELIAALAQSEGLRDVKNLRNLASASPAQALSINSALGRLAFRQLRKRFGRAMLRKLVPFGIGAWLGGRANRKIAQLMVQQVHETLA